MYKCVCFVCICQQDIKVCMYVYMCNLHSSMCTTTLSTTTTTTTTITTATTTTTTILGGFQLEVRSGSLAVAGWIHEKVRACVRHENKIHKFTYIHTVHTVRATIYSVFLLYHVTVKLVFRYTEKASAIVVEFSQNRKRFCTLTQVL